MLSTNVHPAENEKLLAPEVMLPVQLFVRSDAPARGERRLLMALLEQAIGCYRKHAFATNERDRRLFAEAEAWMMDDETDVAFPYQDLCDFLGIDASYVREALVRWRERERRLRRQPEAA